MDNLDDIDDYFTGNPLPDETRLFGQRIVGEPDFADQVAFYLAAMQTAKAAGEDEKKERFRELYRQTDLTGDPKRAIRLWPFIAAAAVMAGVVLCLAIFLKPYSPERLAANYIRQHLQTLGVTMNGGENRLQTGLRMYNAGRLPEALLQFEKIIASDTSAFKAEEYAGIVCLRLGEYDKALVYFGQLENYRGLYANPAKFYLALTLLKRDLPGDAGQAKNLLQQVVQNDLEGKQTAQEWLKKL